MRTVGLGRWRAPVVVASCLALGSLGPVLFAACSDSASTSANATDGGVDSSSPDASTSDGSTTALDGSTAPTDGSLDAADAGPACTSNATALPIPPNLHSYGTYGLLAQPDGKILAFGYGTSITGSVYLARYLPSFALDTSFGTNGIATITPAAGQTYYPIVAALAPDGKIVVAGTAQAENLFLARLDSSGAIDATFGTAGFADAAISSMRPAAILLRPNGTIVVAGDHFLGGIDYEYVAAQYTSAGAVDTNFGTNGYVTTAFGSLSIPNTAILQPDGNVVLVGHTSAPSDSGTRYQIALARYTTAGVLDATFGTGGTTLTDLGGSLGAEGAIRQSTGAFIVGVASAEGLTEDFMTFRYTSAGVLDTTYGTNSVVRTDFQGGPDYAYSITLGANDGFLMSGISAPVVDGGPGAYQIALARYTSSGALDTTFGTAGKTLVALTAQSLQNANGHIVTANGIVVAATGKATVDGSTTDESNLLLVCP